MVPLLSSLVPYAVLVSHVLFVMLLLALIFRNSWGKNITSWLSRHAIALALIVSLAAVGGSLFYSEIVGFEPCPLCWWQRLFLFPLAVIFGVAWWKKLDNVFLYAVPLALLAIIVSGYHSYFELGGASLLPCTAEGGACSRVYVKAFGYITIPTMSLTVSLYILLLAWARRLVNRAPNA